MMMMKKTDKEEHIFELRLSELESKKFMGDVSLKASTILAAVFAFLWINGVLIINDWIAIFKYGYAVLLLLIWIQFQIDRYVADCYVGLFNAIKADKLMDFEFPSLGMGYMIWYKRKFSPKN